MEKIFSALVFGATLPKPILVREVKVKYKAVMYLDRMSGPDAESFFMYGDFVVIARWSSQLMGWSSWGRSM